MPFHKLDKKGIMIYLIKSLGQVNSAKIGGTALGIYPRGRFKIDENDALSVQSGNGRLSCSRTALKRCTSTETR